MHDVSEFAVLSERPGESFFFEQTVKKTLTENSQQQFLDKCLEMASYTAPGVLEKIIRRGLYQYVGLGQVLVVDNATMEAVYLESLVCADIINRLQSQKIATGDLAGAANLFMAATVEATAAFNAKFCELFRQHVTVCLQPIDKLDGARLIYQDGSMINLINDKSGKVVLRWRVNDHHQKLLHLLHGEQTKHGLVAALELYMRDNQVTPQYATVLAMRFNLDLNLVPANERHLVLERDLGL